MDHVFRVAVFFVASFLWVGFALSNEFEAVTITRVPKTEVLGVSTQLQHAEANPITANYIIALNAYRQLHGLNPVRFSAEATDTANARVDDMVLHDYFSHTTPQGGGYVDMVSSSSGYSCENLLLSGTDESLEIIEAWKLSPAHDECLLAPRVTSVGFAVARYTVSDDGKSHYIAAAIALEN